MPEIVHSQGCNAFMSANELDKPKSEELEISLFGPGYGECIVMHIGGGDWIIVDSCLNPDTSRPASLEYFERIGVNPATSVKAVIASHWHDDHIRGLFDVVRACSSAEFVCSASLTAEKFIMLLELFKDSEIDDSGLCEFERVLAFLEGTRRIRHAVIDRTILADTQQEDRFRSCKVHCLSPLDDAVTRATRRFASHYCSVDHRAKKRMPALSENDCSIVLKVTGAGYSFLLGSDLENKADVGWEAVISKYAGVDKSLLFKVPHHGSDTAHHDGIWTDMLKEDDPYALITPFVRGCTSLPKDTDIDRIKAFTGNAFITCAPSKANKRAKYDNQTDKFLKQATKQRRKVYLSSGHVRLRVDVLSGNVCIDTFNGAEQL